MDRLVVLSNLPPYPSKWSLQKALETECGKIIQTVDINPDDKSEAVVLLKRKEDRAVIHKNLKYFVAQADSDSAGNTTVVIKQEFQVRFRKLQNLQRNDVTNAGVKQGVGLQEVEKLSESCSVPMQKPISSGNFKLRSNGPEDDGCKK